MAQKKQIKAIYEKQLTVWLVLGLLLVTLCISWASFSSYVRQLEIASQGHSLVDYLNASVQRLVKLELLGTPSDELIFNLDNTLAELQPTDGGVSDYFEGHSDILNGISNVSIDWDLTKTTLTDFRVDGDPVALISSSERLFYHAANLTNLTSDHISVLSVSILRLQLLIIMQMLIVAVIISHRLYLVFTELKRNKELSASMFIDSATGLFNRSKCHEVLRTITGGEHSRAMLVFDLNDLKKTNDMYGHRVGDELIYSFAQIIKDATNIHTQDVFIGRYGGDEFMVYYNSIDYDNLILYLKEVAFLTKSFNEKATLFQISYAAGYAISSLEKPGLTLRQLFDIADKNMYINKAEIKNQQSNMHINPAYEAKTER